MLSVSPKQQMKKINSIIEAAEDLNSLKKGAIVCFDIDDTITTSGEHKQIVEPEIVQMISNLREKGVDVIAVTARPYISRGKSRSGEYPLAKVGVSFKNQERLGDDYVDLGFVDGTVHRTSEKVTNCQYENGILYTDTGHKGQALFKLLRQRNITVTGVDFFDDTQFNVTDMYQSCEENGVKFRGYEYLARQHQLENQKQENVSSAPNNANIEEKSTINSPAPLIFSAKNAHTKNVNKPRKTARPNKYKQNKSPSNKVKFGH